MKKGKKNTKNQPKETKKAETMVAEEQNAVQTKESKKDKKKKKAKEASPEPKVETKESKKVETKKADKITNKGDIKKESAPISKYIYPDGCEDSLDRKKFRSKIRALDKQYKKKLEKDPKNSALQKEYMDKVLRHMVTAE